MFHFRLRSADWTGLDWMGLGWSLNVWGTELLEFVKANALSRPAMNATASKCSQSGNLLEMMCGEMR